MSEGSWTVFAPNNAAFEKLGDTLDAVLADKDLLTSILLFHAVEGEVYSKDLKCRETVTMANRADSRTVCRGDSIFQKGAGNSRDAMPEILTKDIKACNSVLHEISGVMLFNSAPASAPVSVPAPAPASVPAPVPAPTPIATPTDDCMSIGTTTLVAR